MSVTNEQLMKFGFDIKKMDESEIQDAKDMVVSFGGVEEAESNARKFLGGN